MYGNLHTRNTQFSLPFILYQKYTKALLTLQADPSFRAERGLTEKLSQMVDLYLTPHVYGLTLFIKDTIQFLGMIENLHIPPEEWLITIDIEMLYAGILHYQGIFAVSQFLKIREQGQLSMSQFILDALEFIFCNNVFTFDEKIFLQIEGVAIGTPCALSYANLYLGWREQQLLEDDTLPMHLCHVLTWHRYINTIFILLDSPETRSTLVPLMFWPLN